MDITFSLAICFRMKYYISALMSEHQLYKKVHLMERQSYLKREEERATSHLLVYSPNGHNSLGWQDQSQEPETPFGSPLWVAGAQAFGVIFCYLPWFISREHDRNGAAWPYIDIHL